MHPQVIAKRVFFKVMERHLFSNNTQYTEGLTGDAMCLPNCLNGAQMLRLENDRSGMISSAEVEESQSNFIKIHKHG